MRMTRIFRAAAVAGLAIAVVGLGTVGASASETKYRTDLRMSEKYPAFHGKVRSKSDFCIANRPVVLYRERRGAGAVDIVLGETMSRSNGGWKIKVNNLRSGVYYSFAPRYSSASLGITCRADRSKIAVVD